jgi:hypothetical protein
MGEQHIYRLIVCPRCGLRTWTVDQEPAPYQHSHPQTGVPCVTRVSFNEIRTFMAEDQGPGLHPRQAA